MMAMRLDEYLSAERMTEAEFGAQIKLSQAQVNRIRRGESWPSRSVIERIAKVTKNRVTANDFVGLERA